MQKVLVECLVSKIPETLKSLEQAGFERDLTADIKFSDKESCLIPGKIALESREIILAIEGVVDIWPMYKYRLIKGGK